MGRWRGRPSNSTLGRNYIALPQECPRLWLWIRISNLSTSLEGHTVSWLMSPPTLLRAQQPDTGAAWKRKSCVHPPKSWRMTPDRLGWEAKKQVDGNALFVLFCTGLSYIHIYWEGERARTFVCGARWTGHLVQWLSLHPTVTECCVRLPLQAGHIKAQPNGRVFMQRRVGVFGSEMRFKPYTLFGTTSNLSLPFMFLFDTGW